MKNFLKIAKISSGLAVVALLYSCQSGLFYENKKETKDCSAIFEKRYTDKNGKENRKLTAAEKKSASAAEADSPPTECKVLSVKFDKNNKCEFVGSDRIDALSETINDDKQKIVLIAPENQLRDLINTAQSYLNKNGVNLQESFDSDLFKSLNFPYKGMRCDIAGKKVVAWLGHKKVIVSIEKNS
jgi:hypothetical protein